MDMGRCLDVDVGRLGSYWMTHCDADSSRSATRCCWAVRTGARAAALRDADGWAAYSAAVWQPRTATQSWGVGDGAAIENRGSS